MKGWITTALLVTFLSGGTTGFLVGRGSAPPLREKTEIEKGIEKNIETLRERGVTRQEDLDHARRVYEDWARKILALKDRVMVLFKDQIGGIDADAEREIRKILAAYPGAEGATR